MKTIWKIEKRKGCERLAIIEENIVLAFTEAGGNDDSRFTMLQNRASAVSKEIPQGFKFHSSSHV